MGCQLAGFMRVVAGHVGDHGAFAPDLLQDGFQALHALFLFLIDAFAGGAADIQALHAFADQVARQLFRPLLLDSPDPAEGEQQGARVPDDHVAGNRALGAAVVGVVPVVPQDEVFPFSHRIGAEGI